MGARGETPDRKLARIAGRQHGVVGVAQLKAAGLTPKAVEVRVRRGQLHRLFTGVYLVGVDRPPAEAWWMAGVLTGGHGAVLSHVSAAALWEIGPRRVLPVHVIAPSHRRSRPGLRIHQSATLVAQDITTRRGIPVTSVARTLADLPRAERDSARVKARVLGLLTGSDLLGAQPEEPVTRSRLERRFLRTCRRVGLPAPEVNVAVEGRERDFAWRAARLVVEIDGPHHDDPAQRAVDRARDRELSAVGWRVIRAADGELAAAAQAARRALGLD